MRHLMRIVRRLWTPGVAALGIAVMVAALTAPAIAAKRVALVIGNSAYANATALPNPTNDAEDMAALLTGLGFDVTVAVDADRYAMETALTDLSDAAVGAEIGLVFFAGHGLEIDRENYLIPVDATLSTDRRLPFETVSLDNVLSALDGVSGVRVVLLDACRNNPLANRMQVTRPGRSISRGLARIEAATGTLISFATEEGAVADDGTARNSPFTTALLANLGEPGQEIGLLFRQVRDDVMSATGGEQQPYVSASLSSQKIYFVPPSETPQSSGAAGAVRDYEAAERIGTVAAWDAFLTAHPDGLYADLGRAAHAKLTEKQVAALGNAGEAPDPRHGSLQPLRVCTHQDTILRLADHILGSLTGSSRLTAQRLAVQAAYFKIRYGRLGLDDGLELLRPLLDNGAPFASDLAVAFALSERPIDEALALIDPDPLQAFYKLGPFGFRALIFNDGGARYLQLVRQAFDAKESNPAFLTSYRFGLQTPYPIIDRDDAFKRRFAQRAETAGELVLSGAILATLSSLDEFHAFLDRHADDARLHQMLDNRTLTGQGLTVFHDTGPLEPAAERTAPKRVMDEQIYSIVRAAFRQGEQDLLSIFVNMSGELASTQEVADNFVAQVAGGFINPDRDPADGWVYVYRQLVSALGRARVEEQMQSFSFPSGRHFGGLALESLGWMIATEELTPYLRWVVGEPGPRPQLLPAKIDWTRWTDLAKEVHDGSYTPKQADDDESARILVELLYAAGQTDPLFAHIEANFENEDTLVIFSDLMGRLDRRCSGFSVYPGQALMWPGFPVFTFPSKASLEQQAQE